MPNPAGNYPGRQIFLGKVNGKPAFVYFVSGRSDPSKQRYASPFIEQESAIRIKPIDPNEPFDPFRHYQAVRIDPKTGLLVVSNSQAPNDAVFEAYNFMSVTEKVEGSFLKKLLRVIGPEYDNKEKPTSRVVGVSIEVSGHLDLPEYREILGITQVKNRSFQFGFWPIEDNTLYWLSTYNGNVDYRNFDPSLLLAKKTILKPEGRTPQELANEIYGMSDYVDPQYDDLRVCVIAGVRNGNGPGGWELARKNRHQVE